MGFRSLVDAGLALPEPSDQQAARARRAIAAALVAYAAGDAFGVPYEFLEQPIPVDTTTIGVRPGWPSGGVSDDTTLTLLTIGAIRHDGQHDGQDDHRDDGPDACAARFLTDLRAAVPHLRGLGPTTRAALGLEVPEREIALIGSTNGAMMRTALLGLAFDPADDAARRELVHALALATHKHPVATVCAVLASKLFSVLAHGTTTLTHGSAALPAAAIVRAEALALEPIPATVRAMLDGLDGWQADPAGVSLDPAQTLAAVVTVASGSTTCLGAYRAACELGGDTDTVSALAAAAVAARDPDGCGLYAIGWLDDVGWAEIPELSSAISRLIALRENGYRP